MPTTSDPETAGLAPPVVSVWDDWFDVRGLAHLFPAGGGRCLCGSHGPEEAGDLATCQTRDASSGRVHRPYCSACVVANNLGWLHKGARK